MKKIVHVAPQLSISGNVGGSYSVAFNFAESLGGRGNEVILVTHSGGTGYHLIQNKNFIELSCDSYLISKRIKPSSFVPTTGFKTIVKYIFTSEIVHVHLSREIFPILCSYISLILGKRLIIQCHGMIVRDRRFLVRVLDLFLLRFLFIHSSKILVLTKAEESRLPFRNTNLVLFGNGIKFQDEIVIYQDKKYEVIFLGRLNKVKRPEKFVQIISKYNKKYSNNLESVLFGPDGGSLESVSRELELINDKKIIYGGSLERDQVSDLLNQSKVLFMTSIFENFPMVVVECLATGTPVLILSHFDIAKDLSEEFPEMVIDDGNVEYILMRLRYLADRSSDIKYRKKISRFSRDKFNIENLSQKLETEIY